MLLRLQIKTTIENYIPKLVFFLNAARNAVNLFAEKDINSITCSTVTTVSTVECDAEKPVCFSLSTKYLC